MLRITPTTFSCSRWIVIVLFIVCNVITCSISSWNISLAHAVGRPFHADEYLIFVSALGLLVAFPCIILDLIHGGKLQRSIWALPRVAFFSVLECSAAIVVTVVLRDSFCISSVEGLSEQPCIATKVLMTFTWFCTCILILYMALLYYVRVRSQKEGDGAFLDWASSAVWYPSTKRESRGSFEDHISYDPDKRAESTPVEKTPSTKPLCSEYEIEHLRIPDRSLHSTRPQVTALPIIEPITEEGAALPMSSIPLPAQAQVRNSLRNDGTGPNPPMNERRRPSISLHGQPRVRPAGPRARTSSGAS